MSPPSPLPSPPSPLSTNDFWYRSIKHDMDGLYNKEGPFTSDKGNNYYILTPVNKDKKKPVLKLTEAELGNVEIIDINSDKNTLSTLRFGGASRKTSRKNPKKKTRRNRRKSIRCRR